MELHAANGYLITQFLSSAINDRRDEFGGSLAGRARFLLEIIRAIRREVGRDFHLQVKISAVDHNNAVIFWDKRGNTLEESIEVCKWAEEAGADALHVSTGSMFPHPRNPAGGLPVDVARETYDTMLSSGLYTFRNYLLARWPPLRPIFRFLWNRTTRGLEVEGANAARRRRRQEGGLDPGAVHGRLPDRLGDPRADRGGAVRRRHDRPPADRQQRPRQDVRRGPATGPSGRAPTATDAS